MSKDDSQIDRTSELQPENAAILRSESLFGVKYVMDQIEEVKRKTDIVSLISESLPLKKAGRNFKTNCPFHGEKTPSFLVSPELQIFKCFGCGVGGDAVRFLQLYEKMDFWEAVEFLAKRAGIKLVHRQMTKDEQLKNRLYQVNSLAAQFYHFLLTQHSVGKKALDYVLSRGIKRETIKKFQMGFSPMRREAVVNFLKRKGYSPEEVEKSGLIFSGRQGGWWDRFSGRVIFPLFNHRGLIVGFSGRIIPGVSPPDAPKYINTPETAIYHKSENLYGLWLAKEEARKSKEVVVVEGEFDVISPYQAGLKNIIAIKGTAFTEDQARLIGRFAETAILALDTDAAGSEAVKRSSQIAESVGLNVKIAVLPSGFKDLDELVRKDSRLITKVLAKTIPIWDFIIGLSAKKNDPKDPIGKKKILSEILPFLTKIDNEVVKDHYLQKLAEVLSVGLESVLIEAGKLGKMKTGNLAQKEDGQEGTSSTRRGLLEKHLLILIFANKDWRRLKDTSLSTMISNPLLRRIVDQAKQFLSQNKDLASGDFFSLLPAELKSGFEEIYLASEDEGWLLPEKEVEEVIKEIKKDDLRSRLSKLSLEIYHTEKEGNHKKITALEKEFVDLSHRLVALEND